MPRAPLILVVVAVLTGAGPGWSDPAGSEETARACRDVLARASRRILRLPPRRWPRPALEALAACPALPESLRDGARLAARADPRRRAAILARHARRLSAEGCRPLDAWAPATSAGLTCPPPQDLPGPEAVPPLDAGTWVFSIATWRALVAAGAADGPARMLLDELWQGVGLQRHRMMQQ